MNHPFTQELQLIDQKLDALLSNDDVSIEPLFEAARYTVLGPNCKRIRPLLCLLTAELLGTQPEVALIPACALEFVHNYSLIHDDLPSMDNDDFRRGRPTLHKQYSEGHAILTGDFLYAYAFEILADASSFSAEDRVLLIQILAKACGAQGMVGGQATDIAATGQKLTIEELEQMHLRKTGALITASVLSGAVVGKATQEQMAILEKIGGLFGLGFQILDDIIDVKQSIEKHGTLMSTDEVNQKMTYVTLLGLAEAEKRAMLIYNSLIKSLDKLGNPNAQLRKLADLIWEQIR